MINNIEITKEMNVIKVKNVEENLIYQIEHNTKEFSVQSFYTILKYDREKKYKFKKVNLNGKNEIDILFNKVNEMIDKLLSAINEKTNELKIKVPTEDLE